MKAINPMIEEKMLGVRLPCDDITDKDETNANG